MNQNIRIIVPAIALPSQNPLQIEVIFQPADEEIEEKEEPIGMYYEPGATVLVETEEAL